MDKNIKLTRDCGGEILYMTSSSDDLKMPSLGFNTEEEAEFAVALARLLKANGKEIYNLGSMIPYVFRVIGLLDNPWSE
jgi:hypothetical protein